MIINDFNFIPAFKGYESDELQPKDPLSAEVLNYANNGKTMPWVFMGYPSGWGENAGRYGGWGWKVRCVR